MYCFFNYADADRPCEKNKLCKIFESRTAKLVRNVDVK